MKFVTRIRSKISYVIAGFVGGVAFLVSCSGGSGGGPISDAEAAVSANQMYCEGATSLWQGASNGIPNIADALVCYETNGTGRSISIADAYAEGWRIQLMAAASTAGLRYIFEK